ncbi:hypothetical protein V495_06889 [Pseudogymnoascus sp. VKM F-4514 (FW-929)]|nr:hypothetical protein V495_06889 [Pseudogymnoascus sp. VKM F-4514 (FW-929)]KFY53795.1 hypothetical protein V497_08247 [Pseudogymnoascus sp. VKM F-4516 (FW-969)]
MSIPRPGDLASHRLPLPRYLTGRRNSVDVSALSRTKVTGGTAASIRSIHAKNGNSHYGAVQRVTPNRNAPQESTEVDLECKSKIQVSYTISEDMSGNCKKNILSRISQKRRDSRDVRLRIGSSCVDSWSLRDRRETAEGHNRGVASSRSASPHIASRASPQTAPYQKTQQQMQSNQVKTPLLQAEFQPAQQQAIRNVLLQNIQSQTGPLVGWRASLLIKERLGQVWHIFTQLRAANPNNVQQDVQKMCTLALNSEKGAFDVASNRDSYLELMRDKLEQLQEARRQLSQDSLQVNWIKLLRTRRNRK